MLSTDFGELTRVKDRDWLTTQIGRRGYVLYGPYEPREPGHYVVDFLLASKESHGIAAADGICAVVDVVKDNGQTDIAMEYVLRSELNGATAVRL